MNYRFEKNDEEFQIIEVRPWASFNVDLENEELVVFSSANEKYTKDLYRRMKRGQCGFNGWTPNFLLT